MPHIGQRLGRYEFKEQIGAGGMGVVYRAYDEKLQRDLAIKVLAPGTLDDDAARKRFRNEALALSRLNHPSIQTIHDFETVEGQDFLVGELVPGTSLDARVRAGALTEKEVIRLGLQLAEGLAAAHNAGVLHRDLKPSNLRVTPDGRLKILDFGLATLTRNEVLGLSTTVTMATAPTGVVGTLPYMSPEQLLNEQVDERSDIYSAGVVLFELATGRLPFQELLVPRLTDAILHQAPPSPRGLIPRLSSELDRIVLKSLEKDPSLRYQSAKELATDLRRLEIASSVTAAPPGKKRRTWVVPTAAAGICAAIALSVFLLPRYTKGKTSGAPGLRWERLTNFDDSAEVPAVSPDGKFLAFIRGSGGGFGGVGAPGQIWLKPLPNGELTSLTSTNLRKDTLSFSRDGSTLYFTQIEAGFAWNTYELPLVGRQEPKLFMSNATGLSWIANDRVMFSTIRTGIHMKLATSNASRSDQRNVYVPRDDKQGMVHRSALSPDGKWALGVEMDSAWWRQCRLVPFDGSSDGRSVGPEGSCTAAAWSPDGEWMYFTVDTRQSGSHVWRQHFPEGEPQQLTPSGAGEEEGIAMMPDGKSFITSSGAQQSAIWLHDGKADRQITAEEFSYAPMLSPDEKKVYFLRQVTGSHSFFSAELWVCDLTNGAEHRLFPGLVITHFAISQDGNKVVFATEQGQERSGVWIGWLDGSQPPRQLTFGGEFRAFFGKPGQLIYQGNQASPKIMSIKEDGSGAVAESDMDIMQLQNVSPDGKWALVGVTPPGSHGNANVALLAVPVGGGEPITLCDQCGFGFGWLRRSPAMLTWSLDGKWLYVALRAFPFDSRKTAAISIKPGSAPPSFVKGFQSEADFARIPGVQMIDQENVYPGNSPRFFVTSRRSAKTNLFRIYLQP